jgi:hypothetical protein
MTGEGMRRQAIILWRILVKLCGGPSDFQYARVLRIDKYKKSTQSAAQNHLAYLLLRTTPIHDLICIYILLSIPPCISLSTMDIEDDFTTGPTGHAMTAL